MALVAHLLRTVIALYAERERRGETNTLPELERSELPMSEQRGANKPRE